MERRQLYFESHVWAAEICLLRCRYIEYIGSMHCCALFASTSQVFLASGFGVALSACYPPW